MNISIPSCISKNENGDLTTEDDGNAVVDWHRDSHLFVCVLMMSDTTGMVHSSSIFNAIAQAIVHVCNSMIYPHLLTIYSTNFLCYFSPQDCLESFRYP